MTAYRCLALSPDGRKTWRMLEAGSEKQAVAVLIADGFTPLDIRSGAVNLMERLNQPVRFARRLGINEQSLMLSQLAMLVGSGLPVDRSLDLLRDQAPRASQRAALGDVLADVRAGTSLAKALHRRDLFPGYVIGVLRSAERSGRLGEALTSVSFRMNSAAKVRRELITALTYPAAVLAATLLALLLVLIVVVPQFAPIFAGEEMRLPALTRLVLALSAIVHNYGPTTVILCPAVLIGLYILMRSARAAAIIQHFRHRIPGIGLRDQYVAAQVTGILATLLANGVTVINALPLAREAVGSTRWKIYLTKVERRIREGSGMSHALAQDNLVPQTAIRLIQVGERSGDLANTCRQASSIMEVAAKARLDRIILLANPIAITSLGGLVALLVGGVMLGIFSMGDIAL